MLALLRYVACGLLGVLLGVIGTAVHRWEQPWGLVLALACVLSSAVLARAWTGWVGPLALAMGLVVTVGVLALEGPGGDVLIAAQPVGYIWYAGAPHSPHDDGSATGRWARTARRAPARRIAPAGEGSAAGTQGSRSR